MRPYLYLRRWWRRTTAANRAMTTVSTLVAVALLAWIFSPTGGTDGPATANLAAGATGATGAPTTPTSLAGGEAAPAADPAAVAGQAPASQAGTSSLADGQTAATAAEAAGQPATTTCLQPPSGTPGIDDGTITVAAIVLNLAGPIGNSSQGLATPEEFRKMGDAVAADINARGGVQCRKLQVKYYEANPLSQDQQRSTCLQVVQERPFMAVDFAGFAFPPAASACLPQQKVPFVAVNFLLPSDIQRFQPYLATLSGNAVIATRDAVLAMKERGLFDPAKGFEKLGLLVDDCAPEAVRALEAALREVGVEQVSTFAFSCPTGGFAPPNEMSQAVTQHRLDGVTHVIPLTGSGSFNTYTNVAQSQRFRPMYGVMDQGNIPTTQGGSTKANAENFNDNNLIVTVTRRGQERSPQQDPGTARCQSILVKAGLPATHVFQAGGGFVCSQLWTVQAALSNARALTRDQALPGLFNAGSVVMAYPTTDTNFRAPLKLHGGDTWWPIQYQGGCACFRPLDPNRRPTFAR